jgi:hypothetical protein
MKLYIGSNNLEDKGYKCITEPKMIEYVLDDSEATEIVFDNILRSNFLNEVDKILALAKKKLRLSGTVTIIDIDFDLLQFAYSKTGNIIDLNNGIINGRVPIRSFLNNELIVEIAKSKGFIIDFVDIKNVEFIVSLKRINNGI